MFGDTWVLFSIVAYVLFSSRFLIRYYNVDEETAPLVMCFLLGVIACVHAIWYMYTHPTNLGRLFDGEQAIVLFVVAFTWYLANILYVRAMLLSPNSGYVHAFAVIQVLIVFLLSVYLLNDRPDAKKVMGMIFAMIGIVLLSV